MAASYTIAIFSHQESVILPIWVMVFADAAIAVAVSLLMKDPDAQATTFKVRVENTGLKVVIPLPPRVHPSLTGNGGDCLPRCSSPLPVGGHSKQFRE